MSAIKRKFSINLLFLLGLNLLVKPAYLFGVEVAVQNRVGASEYGLYYALFNFTFLFNVVLDMGINNFQRVRVAEDRLGALAFLGGLLPLKLWLGLIYAAVTLAAAFALDFEGRYWFFIAWLLLNHFLSAMLLTLRASLGGLQVFWADSVLSVADRLLMCLGIGYLLLSGPQHFQIQWLVQGQSIAYGCSIAFALFVLLRNNGLARPDFKLTSSLKLLRASAPFALLILLMTIYSRVDAVMLERMAPNGLREAGIYAQAYRIADAGNNFAFLFAALLLPLFGAHMRPSDRQALHQLTDLGARLLIIPALMALVVALAYGPFIMELLYEGHTRKSTEILYWLMGSFVFTASGYVFGTLITASGNLKRLNIIALITVLINVVCNVVFIPKSGATGAAISSFISLSVMGIAQGWSAYSDGLAKDWHWLKLAALAFIATLAVAQTLRLCHLESALGLCLLLLFCLALMLLAVLRKDDFRRAAGQLPNP